MTRRTYWGLLALVALLSIAGHGVMSDGPAWRAWVAQLIFAAQGAILWALRPTDDEEQE